MNIVLILLNVVLSCVPTLLFPIMFKPWEILHFIVSYGELHLVTDRCNLQGNVKWNVRGWGNKSANMTKHDADKNSNKLTHLWTILPELNGRVPSPLPPVTCCLTVSSNYVKWGIPDQELCSANSTSKWKWSCWFNAMDKWLKHEWRNSWNS